MQSRKLRFLRFLLPAAVGAGFMLLCRTLPGFAAHWVRLILRPFGLLLSHFSSTVPFPVAELIAAPAVALVVSGLFICIRRPALLKQYSVRITGIITAFFCIFLFFWFPAYPASPSEVQTASAEDLNALCFTLIQRLNAADLRFSGYDSALAEARAAVAGFTGTNIPENAVKVARYPEWMDALGVSGLYAFWTGEAIVHPRLVPAARIFTAAHELMHGQGIADEGRTNILAYEACRARGGEAAASADLWALKYAMRRLRTHSEDLWRERTVQMDYALVEVFASINGFTSEADASPGWLRRLSGLAGTVRPLSDYDALADHLSNALSVD